MQLAAARWCHNGRLVASCVGVPVHHSVKLNTADFGDTGAKIARHDSSIMFIPTNAVSVGTQERYSPSRHAKLNSGRRTRGAADTT